jgi:hypothetical protein
MGRWRRWGREGPPPEAYSRVTNSERFQPLHALALELIDRLEASFKTQRVEGYGIDPEMEELLAGARKLARPTIKLVPENAKAAPLTIVFSGFPGIGIRAGHWYLELFPNCGCDACDDTLDGEAEQIRRLVEDVTSGRFREAIYLTAEGGAWQGELWSPQGSSSRRGRLQRSLALQRAAQAGGASFEWQPWPARDQPAAGAALG